MDLSQSLNLNTASNQPLFSPTFLNLQYLFDQILNFFIRIFDSIFRGDIGFGLNILFSVCAILFITIICYCAIRMLEIRKKEHEYLHHEIAEYAEHKKAIDEKKRNKNEGEINERWRNVLNYLSSSNHSDWKLAILEADAMLEELTDNLEFRGENIGEKLKGADREKFKSLDDAWEAHIVRNKIAHEGSQFELSQREANRVAVLYENVFREFGYI